MRAGCLLTTRRCARPRFVADIDECFLAGCTHAPPIVRECRPTRNISLIGTPDELAECAALQSFTAREGCYEGLKHPEFEDYHALNISWVAVLPVLFGQSNETVVDLELLERNAGLLATPRCDTYCTNFEGTYQCSCDPGFMLDEADIAGHTCRDVNECMDEGTGDPCLSHEHSKCLNIPGGATCSCREGYVGWPIGPAGDGVNASACALISTASEGGG